jgi:hypothetical protein
VKKKIIIGIVLMLVIVGMLSGCVGTYYSKYSYFDGAVIVEYRQTKLRGNNDYLDFEFFEIGKYSIYFSSKNGKHPSNFEIDITKTPRRHIIEQYILPDFLTISIQYNSSVESHEFS